VEGRTWKAIKPELHNSLLFAIPTERNFYIFFATQTGSEMRAIEKHSLVSKNCASRPCLGEQGVISMWEKCWLLDKESIHCVT